MPTLMLKVLAYDEREQRLKRLRDIYYKGTNREVLELERLMGDRIEGTPLKKVAVAKFTAGPTFVFTDADGKEIPDPAIPSRVGEGATPAAGEPLVLAGQVIAGPVQVR